LEKNIETKQADPHDARRLVKSALPGTEQYCQEMTLPIRDWKAALNRFSIVLGDRMPIY
jgi:hypothetical protein